MSVICFRSSEPIVTARIGRQQQGALATILAMAAPPAWRLARHPGPNRHLRRRSRGGLPRRVDGVHPRRQHRVLLVLGARRPPGCHAAGCCRLRRCTPRPQHAPQARCSDAGAAHWLRACSSRDRGRTIAPPAPHAWRVIGPSEAHRARLRAPRHARAAQQARPAAGRRPAPQRCQRLRPAGSVHPTYGTWIGLRAVVVIDAAAAALVPAAAPPPPPPCLPCHQSLPARL